MQKNQAEEHFRQSQQLVQRPYGRKELGKFKKQKASHNVWSINGKRRKCGVRSEKRETRASGTSQASVKSLPFSLSVTGSL